MVNFEVSDGVKFWIFYGFLILILVWGVIDYYFEYVFQIFLSVLILVMIVWTVIVAWNNMNILMPAGFVRADGVKIP